MKDKASIAVEIPRDVTTIGEKTFSDCSSLTSITIPDRVTSIGKDAFDWCTSLTIRGKRGSTAEWYAAEKSIPFTAI